MTTPAAGSGGRFVLSCLRERSADQQGGSMPKFTASAGVPAHARIYLASPIATYSTQRYDRRLATVRRRFADADILEPRLLFDSNSAWKAIWPALLPTLDLVVFFADTDCSVGRGVFAEIQDARTLGVPVLYLADRAGFRRNFDLVIIDDGISWRRYARVSVARSEAA